MCQQKRAKRLAAVKALQVPLHAGGITAGAQRLFIGLQFFGKAFAKAWLQLFLGDIPDPCLRSVAGKIDTVCPVIVTLKNGQRGIAAHPAINAVWRCFISRHASGKPVYQCGIWFKQQ